MTEPTRPNKNITVEYKLAERLNCKGSVTFYNGQLYNVSIRDAKEVSSSRFHIKLYLGMDGDNGKMFKDTLFVLEDLQAIIAEAISIAKSKSHIVCDVHDTVEPRPNFLQKLFKSRR